MIAHDLRGPMANLVELMNLLEGGSLSHEEFKSHLPMFSENLNASYELLENLLFWSRSQFHGEHLKLEHFSVAGLVNDGIDDWRRHAAAKGITIQSLLTEAIMVTADREMIRIVLRNLVSNALKFSFASGTVTLTASTAGALTQITVTDSGIGISPEDQKRLFSEEHFSSKGTANEQGTGLGLILCKDYVKKNQGSISVESYPGKGSRFLVTLPSALPPDPHLMENGGTTLGQSASGNDGGAAPCSLLETVRRFLDG